MNAIEEIIAKLQKYADAKYESGANFIRVFSTSQDGFNVELTAAKDNYTVYFNGWHETFADEDEALNCFAFGLSAECRLKEYRRRNFAYKWTVEYKGTENWIEESTTGMILFPFWAKLEIRYLQNNLVKEVE
jgi:hypothetical protein